MYLVSYNSHQPGNYSDVIILDGHTQFEINSSLPRFSVMKLKYVEDVSVQLFKHKSRIKRTCVIIAE